MVRNIQQSVGNRAIQCVTEAELQQARATLRPADFGVVHPGLPHIRSRRTPGQTAAAYYDQMLDIRRSVNALLRRPTGNQMLSQIEARSAQIPLNGGGNPPTVVDIYSGLRMEHIPRHNGTYADIQRGYRFDGIAGPGQASIIHYNENAPSANRHISLGHELVHAWRNTHGLGIAPPQISPRRRDPVLHRADDPDHYIEQEVDLHALQQEEFETVGLSPTPHPAWVPTENAVRAEHGRPARADYSGVIPGNRDAAITNLDDAVTDRYLGLIPYGNRHKVSNIVHHLED